MRQLTRGFFVAMVATVVWCGSVYAEEGMLVLHVANTADQPLAGVVLSTKGDGSTGPPTDRAGKTRLRLAPKTQPGHWVSLQLVTGPRGKVGLVFISPWNARVMVPSFKNESENFAPIVLTKRGDRALLENPKALEAMAAGILEKLAPKSVSEKLTDEQRRMVLTEQAEAYGLEPDKVDRALRALGHTTNDPYQKGLAALYVKNYPEATRQLSASLLMREKELEKAQAKAVDAAFFLGESLYNQGRYRESADAFQKAAALRADDSTILNRLGLSLHQDGAYAKAEPLYQRALAIAEKVLGSEHPDVAISLNNLAELYHTQGLYAQAEPLHRRALAIVEKVLGLEHPDVAIILGNYAALFRKIGRESEAEAMEARADGIRAKLAEKSSTK